ncbi:MULTISPECIES: hypothetical protein [unclassified Acinetobacter]|uniref:hypothetical protein n=1 Tax=unclassified Acinetobacter TaxID=196816 RepID=UPI00293469BE|nr:MULTISPECIES: hypothetical protein [unclassified Acinetobacter]WOE31675.1 hypothetical protein QSG84_00090 [Acinetobacter sp. SAAs470]WOE37140.1 hypothetical protein QSG86_09135 [Acinetobacter sp. SAAs474]
MSFFGFIPSATLLETIETAVAKEHSKEPLYPYRDQIALMINDEIIDAILTTLLHHFPPSEKRDTAEKLAGYIKSTVAVLLKQLFSKANNDVVKQSIEFSRKSIFIDATGQKRIGQALDQRLVTNLKLNFAQIKAGETVNTAILIELYKQFCDATVYHFMTEFNRTLDLGMIKSKASDLATKAVIKASHIAIDRIFPHLTSKELVALAEYHDTLFHEASASL